MQTIRCSSLPRTMKCPGWLTIEQPVLVESSGPDAALGTAAHALYAGMIAADCPSSQERTALTADKYGVNADDLRRLMWAGWGIWSDELRDRLEVRGVEVELEAAMYVEGVRITGHADLLAEDVVSGDLVVLDWKTGQVEADYHDQLMGYAFLAMSTDSAADAALIVTAYTALGVTSIKRYTRQQIVDWKGDMLAKVNADSKPFCPGQVCAYCPVSDQCPARAEMLAGVSRSMVAITGEQIVNADPFALAKLKPQVDALKKAIDQYEGIIKWALTTTPAIPLNDSEELYMSEESHKSVLLDGALRERMEAGYPGVFETIQARQTVSKSELMKALGGKKKKAFWEELEAAGLVKSKTVTKMATRKIQKEIESE